MKRKLSFSLCVMLLIISTSYARQTKTEDYTPGVLEDYGGGAKKTTTLSTDARLNKIITVEIKEASGVVRRRIVWRKDVEGKWSKADTCFKPSGRAQSARVLYFDKDFRFIRDDFSRFNQNGSPRLESSYVKNESGGIDHVFPIEGRVIKSGVEYTLEERNARQFISEIERDFNAHDDSVSPSPCERDHSCAPKAEIFGGYSYLNAGSEGENISFPLGAHLAFTYMLTRNFGLIADGSFHTKKEMEERITRSFLMGGFQYILVRIQQRRQKDFVLFARLMAGLASDRQKFVFGPASYTDKAHALAIAAGLGLAYPLNSTLFLTLIPDYILTRFNKESQGNLRVSAGVKINLGCFELIKP